MSVDMSTFRPVEINRRANRLVESMWGECSSLRLARQEMPNGVRIIDAGINALGGLEAGRRIAEICMGGMGTVTLSRHGDWPLGLHVHSLDPVVACLGSQYAGWSLSHGEGKGAFYALGSGPGRILACQEKLFDELQLEERAERACLVLEVDRVPPLELTEKIAHNCNISPQSLTLILTPTRSLAGTLQVVSRVLEVALHKAHELAFPLDNIVDGAGSAPVPAPASDFVTAMGRTNDAILFGGQVQLFVSGSDSDAEALCHALPSSASKDYGRPFGEIFKTYDYDFFQIDPMLFSPARVSVHCLDSGKSYFAGQIDKSLLNKSFGVEF